MIEILDNVLQLIILLVCVSCAAWSFYRHRDRGWILLTLFYTCYCMALVYWLLYLYLHDGPPPAVRLVSDLGWYSGCLFLCILLRLVRPVPMTKRVIALSMIAPAVTIVSCLFFFQYGSYLSNILSAAVMGWLGALALSALLQPGRFRLFGLHCILHFILQYAVWFSSCFWAGDTLLNPYFWFDALSTVNLLFLLLSYRKAVAG